MQVTRIREQHQWCRVKRAERARRQRIIASPPAEPHQRTGAAAKDEIEQPCREEGRKTNKQNKQEGEGDTGTQAQGKIQGIRRVKRSRRSSDHRHIKASAIKREREKMTG